MTPSSSQAAIARLDELLLDEAMEEDPRAKSQLLTEGRSIVGEALNHDPQNPELHYSLGLCYYYGADRSDETRKSIEASFKKALDLEPGYASASLHLGQYYFEEGRYHEALHQLSSIDEEFFKGHEQYRRGLKNRELILCCRLYLAPAEVPFEDVNNLCIEFESAEAQGLLWPTPTDILECLNKMIGVAPDQLRPMAQRVLKMLADLEFEDAPAIAERYRALKAVVSDD